MEPDSALSITGYSLDRQQDTAQNPRASAQPGGQEIVPQSTG